MYKARLFSLLYEHIRSKTMLYDILIKQVTNELTPYPEFINEYTVVEWDATLPKGKTILYRTNSEDKAYALLAKVTALADIRDQ